MGTALKTMETTEYGVAVAEVDYKQVAQLCCINC
jgi:hypothetical protein